MRLKSSIQKGTEIPPKQWRKAYSHAAGETLFRCPAGGRSTGSLRTVWPHEEPGPVPLRW